MHNNPNPAVLEKLIAYKQFPQGLKALGIEGRRDSDMRFKMYGLDTVLNQDSLVLEPGSNCGFLSALIAQYSGGVWGFDIDMAMVEVANLVKKELGIHNAFFFQSRFEEFSDDHTYDLVVACQLHHWVSMEFEQFTSKIISFVKKGGYLLFETHNINTIDRDWFPKTRHIMDQGFDLIRGGEWVEEKPGRFWIPERNEPDIPRKWFLMRRR